MKLGAQIFTMRDFCKTERDFARTLERVKAMGFEVVQISTISPDITPKRIKELCDANGLQIVLTHRNIERIITDTDRVIEEHQIMDCPYIGIGMLQEPYRCKEWIRYFGEDFRKPAEKIAAAGQLLMYHNHAIEFGRIEADGITKSGETTCVMDLLLDWFSPEEMGVTLDTYWVQAAGADVCKWIAKLHDRLHCVHLKDMGSNWKNESLVAPVMEGNMDFVAIMAALEKTCCKYALIEQDICQEDPFVCMEKSYRNLNKLGYR